MPDLFHGVQLVIDTTMVSPMDAGNAQQPTWRLERAHSPRTCSSSPSGTLGVMVCEVSDRWLDEALSFLNSLANGEVLDKPEDFKKVVKASWLRRWKVLLACAASLLLCSWETRKFLSVKKKSYYNMRSLLACASAFSRPLSCRSFYNSDVCVCPHEYDCGGYTCFT